MQRLSHDLGQRRVGEPFYYANYRSRASLLSPCRATSGHVEGLPRDAVQGVIQGPSTTTPLERKAIACGRHYAAKKIPCTGGELSWPPSRAATIAGSSIEKYARCHRVVPIAVPHSTRKLVLTAHPSSRMAVGRQLIRMPRDSPPAALAPPLTSSGRASPAASMASSTAEAEGRSTRPQAWRDM